MKRIAIIICLFTGLTVYSQNGFRIGFNTGVPLGNNGDFASFAANIELEYNWEVSKTINIGVTAGATVYSGKEEFNDFKYAPILASADVELSDKFLVGTDLGYGASLETNINGAFMYRFQVRYLISDHFDLNARFSSFSGDLGTLSNLSFGVGYTF